MKKRRIAGFGLFLLLAICILGFQKKPEEMTENLVVEGMIKGKTVSVKSSEKEEKIAENTIKELIVEKSGSEQISKQKVSPSISGALQVKGTQLTDSSGNPVQLKGISTHGIAWFPDYINKECFHQLHNEWNINVIRLAMYTAESGGYCTDGNKEYLKNLIKEGVKYATEEDMYVLIDWHILSDCNPETYKKEAKEFFAEMSAEYAEYNNILYEICNEPNGQTSWEQIKAYAEEIIPVIRENDKDGIIIIGTPNWSQYVKEAAANPITGYDNIMYTLHFYAATHTQFLRDAMTEAYKAGLPIFVTEFGICDASGNGMINKEEAQKWIDIMNSYNISYIAWNLSNKNETSAILKSDCQKTYGFEEANLSDSGKWLYQIFTKDMVYPAITPQESETPNSVDSLTSSVKIQEENVTEEVSSMISAGKTGLDYEIIQRNSWETDGKAFYQFEVIITNISGKNCDSWEIVIPFNQNITLKDSWNGNYSVKDSSLYISSKEYNGNIASNGKMGNIGFIVSGNKELKPE